LAHQLPWHAFEVVTEEQAGCQQGWFAPFVRWAHLFFMSSSTHPAAAVGPRPKPRTRHLDGNGAPLYTNRLAQESSPYLRQHAHNPVNWYPWGDEAFADARRLNRPLFLSIGYSTCHWCHVMEEESFEDETIAAFLNAHYVCIKVDREERPDIDAVYMSAVQRLTGQGGWPLSVWLAPDKAPFFGGTYFPPFAGVRGASHGFLDLLGELKNLYDQEPARIAEAAASLSQAVQAAMASAPASPWASDSVKVDAKLVDTAVEIYRGLFDQVHAGLRFAPKFPSNLPIRLLLRHAQRRGDKESLRMAERTLTAMMLGGIYDHLAGGFHRYATDAAWRIPHFEKMLYDNAQLVVAYLEGFQATGRADFARVARETCDELVRTFLSPEGGFYSATDADSEGEEGRSFVWSQDEIAQILGPGDTLDRFLRHYQVTPTGNFEGRTILTVASPDEETTTLLAPARAALLKIRDQRPAPLRDEKIIAAWNGLAISAFALAGRVLGRSDYTAHATRAAEFVVQKMRRPEDGTLARSIRDGVLGGMGFLDDYAFVTAGLLDLFETTAEPRFLREALALAEDTERLFRDPDQGGTFRTSDKHEPLLARERPIFDGAEPSGSAVAFENAARLALLTERPEWITRAQRSLAFYLPHMQERPMGVAHALLALDFMAGPVVEAVLVTSKRNDDEMGAAFHHAYLPRKLLVHAGLAGTKWDELAQLVPWVAGKEVRGAQATATLCRSGRCEPPTTNAAALAEQLQQIAGEFGQG
jgi:uncharacterized protein YyaL (SSP411 family)